MRCLLWTPCVRKRSMRSQPSPVNLRIITFDQSHLLRSLVRKVVPLVIRIILDAVDSTLSIGVDQSSRDEIMFGVEVTPVGHGERFVGDWVTYRSPDVYDSDSAFKEAIGFFTQMTMNSSNTGVEGLVNVDTFLERMGKVSIHMNRSCCSRCSSAHRRSSIKFTKGGFEFGFTSDGVIKDKHPLGSCLLLQQFLNLFIIN